MLLYFEANLSKTLHINFYQNGSSIVEVMPKKLEFLCPTVYNEYTCSRPTFSLHAMRGVDVIALGQGHMQSSIMDYARDVFYWPFKTSTTGFIQQIYSC